MNTNCKLPSKCPTRNKQRNKPVNAIQYFLTIEDDNIDDFDDFNDNENINTDDINVDEYLSDDEIPDYRMHANNYSPDNDEKSIPFASGISFTQFLKNQLMIFFLQK